MKTKTIDLIEPLKGPNDIEVAQVILREPKYRDIMILGEPTAFARSEGGLIYSAERDGVVQGYIERTLIEPKDPALLAQVGLSDALKLKEAVFDFFRDAHKVNST